MPTYVTLMKFTDQGAKDIKNAPERIERAFKGLEAMGGKIVDFYVTMGEYDYVAIAEGPSDEVALTYLMGLGADGNVRTTTLKAFKREDFVKLVKKLP
jgi:uncharacterized protein with GYD domain